MSSPIPSRVTSVEMSYTSNPSNKSSHFSVSTPTSLMSGTGMSGLLNSRNLVQDEKLAVATLATLQSGSASTLIKQDLKWIIQSRRRAEGKSEIEVEFKKPVRDELTSEEVVKRARRRELNRLAARRSRERGQRKKDKLVEEICQLQSQNRELIHALGSLSDEKESIIVNLRTHMQECTDHSATRHAATGLSQTVLEKLGFVDGDQLQPSKQVRKEPPSLTSELYICTPSEATPIPVSFSPPLQRAKTTQTLSLSSCPSSPVVVGLSGRPLVMEENASIAHTATMMHNVSASMSSSSPVSSSSSSPSSSFTASPLSSVGNHPQLGSPISSEGHQRLLSSPHQPAGLRRRNSSHVWDNESSPHPPSPMCDPSPSDDYNFTRPTSPVSRPSRVLLERSYSFPSSQRDARVDFSPGMCFTSSSFEPERPGAPSDTAGSLPSQSDEQEAPLDLVVRNKGNVSREEQFSSYKDERSYVRRRSVDDGVYHAGYREPLNLSHESATSFSYPNLSQESSHSNG